MSYKIYSYPNNPRVYKALIAARYNAVELEVPPFNFGVDNATPDFKKKNPLGKVPVLETPDGKYLWESNAIARYIARLDNRANLYGSSTYEAGLIDQWIDFSVSQIELPAAAWLYPIFRIVENNPVATSNAKGEIRSVLQVLNEHLLSRTFLVGERITLADIVVSTALLQLFTTVLDTGFRHAFSSVVRWFTTLINQPHFHAVLGTVTLATKMALAPKAEGAAAPSEEAPAKKRRHLKKRNQKRKRNPKKKRKKRRNPRKTRRRKNPTKRSQGLQTPLTYSLQHPSILRTGREFIQTKTQGPKLSLGFGNN